ncbi:Uncharacterised protein [Clostridium carnis]|uniref:Uncharacterized protein n=1 Tax=Clostridium carnis TaxID=1530 RepID=A0ABY6SQ76_9CLOT|nr:Uncharacterised protein [Clostridium carnis]
MSKKEIKLTIKSKNIEIKLKIRYPISYKSE